MGQYSHSFFQVVIASLLSNEYMWPSSTNENKYGYAKNTAKVCFQFQHVVCIYLSMMGGDK